MLDLNFQDLSPQIYYVPNFNLGKKKGKEYCQNHHLSMFQRCSCLYHLVFLLYRQRVLGKVVCLFFFLYKGESKK